MGTIFNGMDFGGQLVGKYWVRWMGHNRGAGPEHLAAVLKLNATPALVPVEVRRFDIPGCSSKYVVRVPGFRGYFSLDQFEWHGDYKETGV